MTEGIEAAVRRLVDVRGLICPLPVLRAKKALAALPPGGEIELLATDPMSAVDIPDFAHHGGHALVAETRDAAGVFRFLIRKAG